MGSEMCIRDRVIACFIRFYDGFAMFFTFPDLMKFVVLENPWYHGPNEIRGFGNPWCHGPYFADLISTTRLYL